MASECATLRRLKGQMLLTPKVYGFELRHDPTNDVGVAYILIDELPGKPLLSFDVTDDQAQTAYSDLAGILGRLAEHPFNHVRSLTRPHLIQT